MLETRRRTLLDFVDSEIGRVSENARKVKVTLSHSLSGHSDAGDRYHAQAARDMVEAYLERLKRVKKEIENSGGSTVPAAKPVCFVEIKYEDGNVLGFYFVKEAVSLPGQLLISDSSPLGLAVDGKSVGEKISYKGTAAGAQKEFRAVVVRVE